MVNRYVFLLFFCVGLLIFFLQVPKGDFDPRSHHGWVASHVLAISQHATPENKYVGYACRKQNSAGEMEFLYFDRYPILFSAMSYWVLGGKSNQKDFYQRIIRSQQWMNLIFFLSILLSFILLRSLDVNPWAAASGALLLLSGKYFIEYKDMFHFDQPAVLGLLFYFCAWIHFYNHSQWKWLLVASVISPILGRGYVTSFSALVGFGLLFATSDSKWQLFHIGKKSSWPLVSLLIAGTVSVASLVFNVVQEANIRQVAVSETSIVTSAKKRLGLSQDFDKKNETAAQWSKFVSRLATRSMKGLLPFSVQGFENHGINDGLVALLLLILAVLAVHRRSRWWPLARWYWIDNKTPLLFLILSGFIWLVVLKRLFVPHDYTIMFFIGFNLVVFGLVARIVQHKKLESLAMVLAIMVFVSSLVVKRGFNLRPTFQGQFSKEMTNVYSHLAPGNRIYVHGGFSRLLPHAPYSPCFYLPEQVFVDRVESADFLLTRTRPETSVNLTPNNKLVFLGKTEP